MQLTLRELCSLTICMSLIRVICLNNYYNLSYRPSYKRVQRLIDSPLKQFFPIPNRTNKFMEELSYFLLEKILLEFH